MWVMLDGWEWPGMMSDPRGGPCYLYTDIWLIDWLKIINNSQHFRSTTLWIPRYTHFRSDGTQSLSCYLFEYLCLSHATFDPRSSCWIFPPIRGQNGESLTNQRRGLSMSWPRVRVGDSCGESEGRVNQTFHTLTSVTVPGFWLVAECQCWPLIGQWSHPSHPGGVGRADRQWSQVTSDSRHQSWLGN